MDVAVAGLSPCIHDVFYSSGVPGPGCVGAVRSGGGIQCVSVCLRPNRIWKDVHHDGDTVRSGAGASARRTGWDYMLFE